ncbi:MAG: MmcQ/YjbR family DNA-binding protein [Gemmatimonadota bacterium]
MPRRKPIDQSRIRTLALALPETKEGVHLGRPDFRVKGKIFLTLPEDGKAVHLKTSPTNLDLLVKSAPDTFSDVWGGNWVGVDLAKVKPNQLLDLVIDAWRQTAPKQLGGQPLRRKL